MDIIQGDLFRFSVSIGWDLPPHPKICIGTTSNQTIILLNVTKDKNFVEKSCRIFEGLSTKTFKTMVYIPTSAGLLPYDSYIDCNTRYEEDEYTVLGHTTYFPICNIPQNIWREIKVAVLSSDQMPFDIKKLLM
jgi:hypothetical protein